MAVAPLPHPRQYSPVDTLCGQHIDVVHAGQVLGGESLGGSQNHVTGVVHHHIEVSDGIEHLGHASPN